ncbi:dephospho-CoA kinase [Cellvibrio japonicus]|uniref:Dephospho-CoA kinase n=1 Tax=Cellvibrio japonicus (strain Ueda107) TaxID=498211 RepID=B3PBG6_CELJU|nr:dephospho-CoA kinase [Cellvibrio japonicus]ACE85540.1 dephospho-CoA kinase [Cellvibrio japonicus Ueda107]QEI13082.1 dephospho-CoA kinase [Cellvibrio japonicus]QEI16656.1 dephospho-CoA kinase [Cellvibrio japonicus]QEI20234.1 dephospho-CoA kinase [Cellvibrio japonicus]
MPVSLIIGLTGGIGSGKSEVSRRFEALGVPVIDADQIARLVVEPGTEALASIQHHFGDDILLPDGTLDRARLRHRIFTHPDEKTWLEQLLHPLINQRIRDELQQATATYVMLSSPLLLETQQHLLVDRILVVDTSEMLQIERASKRDASQETQIRAIMATQLSRAERCSRATDIIQNHGDLVDLDEQVTKLHQLYLELADGSQPS